MAMRPLSLNRLFFLLFQVCTPAMVCGQVVTFDHFGVKEGLSQSVILSVFQDSEGFLWFGTQNGLNKFDGYSFEKYFGDPLDSNSISNNWIYAIAEDSRGCLWLGTKGGLNRFDKRTGHFTRVNYKDDDPVVADNSVYGLVIHEDILYINTPPVLTGMNLETGKLEVFNRGTAYEGAIHDIGLPIIRSADGLLWIGSHDGLWCFDPVEKRTADNAVLSASPFRHGHITALFEAVNGNILAGTENGLYILNRKTGQVSDFGYDARNPEGLSNGFIRSVFCDHTGTIWAGTEGGGLNRIIPGGEEGTAVIVPYRSGQETGNSLSHDIVYTLYEDHSHNLWIGTIAGIDKLDLKKKNIRYYRKTDNLTSVNLLDNVIASVYIDGDDRLWIGNWGKGLNVLNRETGELSHYSSDHTGNKHIPENHVHVIFEDSRSDLWLGTRNGVSIFDKRAGKFVPFREYFQTEDYNSFSNNRVYCIVEDSGGRIWIGTGNGICIYDPVHNRISLIRAGGGGRLRISSNLVYSILEDRDGEIWIATPNGLNRYFPRDSAMVRYLYDPSSSNTLYDNFTVSLCEDRLGNIWIGTGSGLNRFSKTDSLFSFYSVKDGLPGNLIYDIVEDNNRNLWLSTVNGLAILDPENEPKGNFRVVKELQGQEFNIKAVYRSTDGEMFFGGIEGLVSFYPDSLSTNSYIPPVRITSFEKEAGGIRENVNVYAGRIHLSFRDYAFTIQFAALDFTHPGQNRFAYRMEGISDEWLDIGTRRFVHFTNLPPGKYTFSVKGTNNDGVWNNEGTGIKVVIAPPWWRTGRAYVAYILLVLLLVILIVRLRERNLITEKRKLEEKVRERTAEIELQKTKVEKSAEELQELNATKDKFFSILAHDLKNPFSNLYSMSEVMVEKYESLDEDDRRMALKNIHKSAEFIFNLLENLLTWSRSQRGRMDFSPAEFNLTKLVDININLHRAQAEQKGIRLRSDRKEDIPAYGDRDMINSVLRNLVNNAVKYTARGGTVEVAVTEKDGFNEVVVVDNGLGISPENQEKLFRIDVKYETKGTAGETGTGLGLVLCREFVEKNGGGIWCESTENAGSAFHFTIPRSGVEQ